MSEDPNQKTVRPLTTLSPPIKSPPKTSLPRNASDSITDDYSDIISSEDETGLTSKFAELKVSRPILLLGEVDNA